MKDKVVCGCGQKTEFARRISRRDVEAPQGLVLKWIYCAPLAQLDRASAYEAEGRVFESPRARHSSPIKTRVFEK
jgi:hypothetical protein